WLDCAEISSATRRPDHASPPCLAISPARCARFERAYKLRVICVRADQLAAADYRPRAAQPPGAAAGVLTRRAAGNLKKSLDLSDRRVRIVGRRISTAQKQDACGLGRLGAGGVAWRCRRCAALRAGSIALSCA